VAEGEEPRSNVLFLIFQRVIITHHRANFRRIPDSPRYRRRGSAWPPKRSSIRTSSRASTRTSWCAANPPPERAPGSRTRSVRTCQGLCASPSSISSTRDVPGETQAAASVASGHSSGGERLAPTVEAIKLGDRRSGRPGCRLNATSCLRSTLGYERRFISATPLPSLSTAC
jgi:hypothetical protein